MTAPVVIGVAGGSGSGKTTVVRKLVAAVAPETVARLPHDAYYRDLSHLDPGARQAQNFDHPEALETELLVEHLDRLRQGQPVGLPVYDFSTHTRTGGEQRVAPSRVVLVDGILVLSEPELRNRMDIRVFVDTDPDVRLVRRLRRDLERRGRSLTSVLDQYEATVRPMHLEFVEPSKRYADVIIPEGGHNRVAVDMLVTKVTSILRRA